MTSYSLKAVCSHCGRFGTVDDVTLVCHNCGEKHEITDEQRRQRDSDLALWQAAMARRTGIWPFRFLWRFARRS